MTLTEWRETLCKKQGNKIADLYPMAKLKITGLFMICTFIIQTYTYNGYPVGIIAWFITLPILAALTGKFRPFMKAMKPIYYLGLFILVVQAFVIKGEDTIAVWNIFNLFNLTVYKNGMITGLSLCFNILDIAGILVWLFACTEKKDIISVMENKNMPPKASYVLLSTMQMIEVLGRKSKTILNAQKARGVETEGNVFVRAKAFVPSMIPLVVGSISDTEERALTLESKGFSVKGKKTHLFEPQYNGCEKASVAVSVVITILVLAWRILVWVL